MPKVVANIFISELRGNRFVVEGAKFHHLAVVKRVRKGDVLQVTDGKGSVCNAKVSTVSRDCLWLDLIDQITTVELAPFVDLFTAPPKGERISWLVEKCTELGVGRINFCDWERSVRKLKYKSLARLRKVAIAAMEQSFGAWLPEIRILSLDDSFSELEKHAVKVVFVPDGVPLNDFAINKPRLALVVGPEGGFTPRELERMRKIGSSFASLTQTVLRIETAAVVSCSYFKILNITYNYKQEKGESS